MPNQDGQEELEKLVDGTVDDLADQMEHDDKFAETLEPDKAHKYLTPKQFADKTGRYPQQIYRLIRQGRIRGIECLCGRTVVEVAEVKEYFAGTNQS